MTRQKIKQVLTELVNTFAQDSGIPIRYPNKMYEPELDTTWLEIFYLNSSSNQYTLISGKEQLLGMLQIDISVPKDTGTYEIDTIIENIKEIFECNGIVRTEVGLVHIGKVYENGGYTSSSWYTKSLTIEYSEFSDN